MHPPFRWLLALWLLAGCRPDPGPAFFIESRTEHGLLHRPRELAVALGETLHGETSVYFHSAIVPAASTVIHTTGRLTVLQGRIQLEYTDAAGRVATVAAGPGNPGHWEADLRALRPRTGENGFLLKLRSQDPTPARQVRLEIAYQPG